MIFLDSRYADGKIIRPYNVLRKTYELTVLRDFPDIVSQFTSYQWVEGDRIDTVSARFFGEPEYWWQILDANPEIINGMEIPIGTILRIPNVS
jgi:hypothetical protein